MEKMSISNVARGIFFLISVITLTMDTKNYLLSLELLRDFVAKVVPYDVYLKNLVIDKIETCNRRLWALRESMCIDESKFAALFGIPSEEYHGYERAGNAVPIEVLQTVADRLSISVEWLLCKCPMLPMPTPKSTKQIQ